MTKSTNEELEYPIAFTLLMHENLDQSLLLLSAIYRTHNLYSIHLDGKVQGQLREALMAFSSCFANIFVADVSVDVVYASGRRLLADIEAMKTLLSLPRSKYNWKYLINLCGQV